MKLLHLCNYMAGAVFCFYSVHVFLQWHTLSKEIFYKEFHLNKHLAFVYGSRRVMVNVKWYECGHVRCVYIIHICRLIGSVCFVYVKVVLWVKKKKVERCLSSQKALVFNNAPVTFSHFHLSIGSSFPLKSRTPLSLICNQNPLSLTSPQISASLSLLPNTSHLVSLLLQRLDFFPCLLFSILVPLLFELVNIYSEVLGNAQASDFFSSCTCWFNLEAFRFLGLTCFCCLLFSLRFWRNSGLFIRFNGLVCLCLLINVVLGCNS